MSEAIIRASRVAKRLSELGLAKNNRNKQQGYNFRGIDDVLNVLSPMLAAEGLVVTPRVLSRFREESTSKAGGALYFVTVEVEYTLWCAEDGSSLASSVYGEGMDSADKATNKAMSSAYKYWAFQTFAIPTVGEDSENDSYDVAPRMAAHAPAKPKPGIPDSAFKTLDAARSLDELRDLTLALRDQARVQGWEPALMEFGKNRAAVIDQMTKEVFGDEQVD